MCVRAPFCTDNKHWTSKQFNCLMIQFLVLIEFLTSVHNGFHDMYVACWMLNMKLMQIFKCTFFKPYLFFSMAKAVLRVCGNGNARTQTQFVTQTHDQIFTSIWAWECVCDSDLFAYIFLKSSWKNQHGNENFIFLTWRSHRFWFKIWLATYVCVSMSIICECVACHRKQQR